MDVVASRRHQILLEGLGWDTDKVPELDCLDVATLDPSMNSQPADPKQVCHLVNAVELLGGRTDGFCVAALRTGVGGHSRRIAI